MLRSERSPAAIIAVSLRPDAVQEDAGVAGHALARAEVLRPPLHFRHQPVVLVRPIGAQVPEPVAGDANHPITNGVDAARVLAFGVDQPSRPPLRSLPLKSLIAVLGAIGPSGSAARRACPARRIRATCNRRRCISWEAHRGVAVGWSFTRDAQKECRGGRPPYSNKGRINACQPYGGFPRGRKREAKLPFTGRPDRTRGQFQAPDNLEKGWRCRNVVGLAGGC